MSRLLRFGVSLDSELSKKFDHLISEKGYKNRSEAIRDLIREELVKKEWILGREVTGAIALVYDHRKRDLVSILTDMQHEFHHIIISTLYRFKSMSGYLTGIPIARVRRDECDDLLFF